MYSRATILETANRECLKCIQLARLLITQHRYLAKKVISSGSKKTKGLVQTKKSKQPICSVNSEILKSLPKGGQDNQLPGLSLSSCCDSAYLPLTSLPCFSLAVACLCPTTATKSGPQLYTTHPAGCFLSVSVSSVIFTHPCTFLLLPAFCRKA